MPKVSNLKIEFQTGSSNTLFATWDFTETIKSSTTTTTTGGITVGALVSIKSGAKWYNGTTPSSWVYGQRWYVYQIKGDRVVINQNESKTNSIMSPIHINNLIGPTVSGGTTTTETPAVNTLDHYEVTWKYDTGNNVWFKSSDSQTNEKNATYSPPENALRVQVTVKPVSKTHTVNNNETSYWSGTETSVTYSMSNTPPEKPSTPSVSIEDFTLTALVDNIEDSRTDSIQFEIYNDTTCVNTAKATVLTCRASHSCTVAVGGKYRVRCRAINDVTGTEIYSEWSSFSTELTTQPAAPVNVTCAADSETSVKVDWDDEVTAESYKVEYTDNKNYFDTSGTSSQTVEVSLAYIVGLESGKEWFFRVCAVNSQGDSKWSDIVSVVIGTKPTSPTTWSSTSTAITGEPLNLYWVHNSEDNSSQTYAELELTIDNDTQVYTIKNSTDDELKDKTSVYSVDTSKYPEGTVIKWRVRTAGATKQYGDWSVMRTINVYSQPTLDLRITDKDNMSISTLTSFPFYVKGLAGPNTQAPIGYHIVIVPKQSYDSLDQIGNPILITEGEVVYSQYYDITTPLEVELSANNVDLQNGVLYEITCTVSMDSGLTAESKLEFDVSWTDEQYEPDAEISIDTTNYSAYIKPYCIDIDNNPIPNIMLSVYRRDFDGGFTEIVKNVDNDQNIFITDPHPGLDYARYRIVAISKTTGAVSFYDLPSYPVKAPCAVIQWNEDWRNLDVINEDAMEEPLVYGSILKLLYNIDVSDNTEPDVELVEYIGRKYPVSYYGTQIGSTHSWNMDVLKEDTETLYALRRLSNYAGDVYAREPSGSGFWANIKVSFSQKHNDKIVPVTLSLTRVEGGM